MYRYIAKYFLLERVYRFCNYFDPISFFLGFLGFAIMSYVCLFILPADGAQLEVYRILFVHVPSAIISELVYLFLAVNGFIFLVWRTKISAIFLNSAITIGLICTGLVLVTGSIWGKPTWGTFWIWDARITSTFILFIQYICLIALKTSFSTKQTADQIISILSIVGAINIPIIKFSVSWWNTLHQGPSITASGSSIDGEMLYALPLMLLAFLFLALFIFLRNIQYEILLRAPSNRKLWRSHG